MTRGKATLLVVVAVMSLGGCSGSAATITAAPSPSASTLVMSSAPAARGYAMMGDLPGDRGVVLLGGATGPGAPDLADMWAFGPDGAWREITPPAVPETAALGPLVGTAFAFDSESRLAVFVDITGHAWAYDPATNDWSAKPSGSGPTALHGAAMVYDAGSDRMIVFGGLDLAASAQNNETWAYDLDTSTWERMHPPVSPSPRNYVSMAYDLASDRVVLFGGAGWPGVLGDTWAFDYDSDVWTELAPQSAPSPRAYSAMAYDSSSGRMVLFGGSSDQETASLGDTWAYDFGSDTWTELSPSSAPGARGWHAMTIEGDSGQTVLFGGGPDRNSYRNDTWLYDPTANAWTEVR